MTKESEGPVCSQPFLVTRDGIFLRHRLRQDRTSSSTHKHRDIHHGLSLLPLLPPLPSTPSWDAPGICVVTISATISSTRAATSLLPASADDRTAPG